MKLPRVNSDPNPLILDTHNNNSEKKGKTFRFERSWVKNLDFVPRVAATWSQNKSKGDSLSTFLHNIKQVKLKIKAWEINVRGNLAKTKKKELVEELKHLEAEEEMGFFVC